MSRNTVFYSWFCGSGGLKSRLAKAAGAETSGEMRDEKLHAVVARSRFRSEKVQNTSAPDHFWKLRCWKSAWRCGAKHISKSKCSKPQGFGPLLEVEMSKKCTPLWREAHFQVKMYKAHHSRTTFGSWDVEKVHAIVARSTFRSEYVQNTTCSRHFWRFGCWKSARRCGAKHISKSKCTKHTMYGPFLEVQMSKKCTPLWREAHFQFKMYKAHHVRTIFGVSDVVSRGGSDVVSWGFVAFSTTTTTTLHYTTGHSNTLHTLQLQLKLHLHYILLHSTTLHRTQLHSTTLHYTTLPSTTLHHTTLHSITLHFTTLHYNYNCTSTLHYTPLHYTATLNYTTLHYITLHDTPLHCTTLHYTTLHYLPLHFTTLHYTTLNYTTTTTTLHYTPLHSTTLNYTTLHYITLHYIPLHFTTLHNTTLHWMTLHRR